MKYFVEIATLFLNFQIYCSKPAPGVNIKKHFEIEFNPTPLKSLELFFEKWSRFGKFKKFGIKRKIEKRDVDNIIDIGNMINNDLTKLSSSEKEDLQLLPVKTESVTVLPSPAQNVVVLSTIKSLQSTEKPPPDLIEKIVMIPVVEPSDEIIQSGQPFFRIQGEPIPLQITTTSLPTTTTPPSSPATPEVKPMKLPGLYTNILQSLNISPVKGNKDQNTEILPVPKLDNPNFFVRGSRFAMYLGSMLLRRLSQYLSGGRIVFSNFPGQDAPLL